MAKKQKRPELIKEKKMQVAILVISPGLFEVYKRSVTRRPDQNKRQKYSNELTFTGGKKKNDAIKMCCYSVFASLIPAGPFERNCGFLLKTTAEICADKSTLPYNKGICWSDRITLGNVFGSCLLCCLFASVPSASVTSGPLPGALDRWAFGAVFYLVAHTVCWITPPIISL